MNGMLNQVRSLPNQLREIFDPLDEAVRAAISHELCLSVKRLFVTGCGDSHHASLGSELAFEVLTGIPTEPMTAQQFARYAAGFIPQTGPKTNLVIGISVSGEVARTVEALTMANEAGATTLALTATPGSRVTSVAQHTLLVPTPPFQDPPGQHIPGVRSYFANQVALLLIAVRLGEVRGVLSSADAGVVRKQILGLADALEQTIADCDDAALKLAQDWKDAAEFVFVGGGPNFATALFSAAKVLEASGDPALGQETEEWCHLQYFARAVDTPTFIITAADRDYSRALEAAVAAKTIGRRLAVVAPKDAAELVKLADALLPIPRVAEMFSPLVAAIPGELFAAYRADVIGEPFFRNFTGGRSVEGGGGISRIRTSEIWTSWKKP